MASSAPSLTFTVRRSQPELVAPAMPTPNEVKRLSEIDDQEGLRFQFPVIQVYRYEPSMAGKDPVKVIRHALSQTLVFYYPFAGRLREGPGRKLMVDCNGEGVMFVEADADVTLDQLGDNLQPPFPCLQKLLYDVPGSGEVVNCPLLLIQVTRLKCGGFILAIRVNHTMTDASGLVQFMNAWAEMTRGASQPSIPPVWRRELLSARVPPRVTCNHREYEQVPDTNNNGSTTSHEDDMNMVHQSFFFGPRDIARLRGLLPLHLRDKCTRFDVIIACFWCCRTKALQLNPKDEVRMMCLVNARARFNPPIPSGYYGNVFAYPAAVTTVEKLCGNSFGFAVELIKKAKAEVTEEYMHSVTDLMVTKGRPSFTIIRSCIVSDLTRLRLREVDFGWGNAVYGAICGAGPFPGATIILSGKNAKGEEGVILPIYLPAKAMKRFGKELDHMLGNQSSYPRSILSTL